MKTSGIKIGIFPILGEVTCLSSLPGDFFSLLPRFFSFFFLAHFCSFLRNHQSTTDHPQLLVPAPSVSLLRSSRSSSSSSNRSSCKHRQNRSRTEVDERSSLVTVFPATFRPLQAAIVKARGLFDSNP